ncbi:type II secretion system F family protein [Kiloniella sp.]|uniref:type II secretion system F family protein n=1 Tax=Kiloniella sp. TaxID=1938587 RepID=UPI003B02E016
MAHSNTTSLKKNFLTSFILTAIRRYAFNTKARVFCWQQCHIMLESGLGIEETLKIQSSTYEIADKPVLAKMFAEIHAEAQRGNFRAAISKYVSSSEAILFSSLGETKVSPIFGAVTRIAKIQELIFRALRKNLFGPIIVIFLCYAMTWAAGTYFIPGFTEFLPLDKWQGISKIFAAICLFVSEHYFIVGLGIILSLVLLFVATFNYSGPARNKLDKFPPFSIYKFMTGVSFLFTLLEFLSAGVDINERNLKRMEKSASPFVRNRIAAIRHHTSRGTPLGKAMLKAGNRFPIPELIPTMIAIEGKDNWVAQMQSYADMQIVRAEDTIQEKTALVNQLRFICCAWLL